VADIPGRRWWALGALTLAVLAVSLDTTILSVALPTLAGALHASESDLQWFQSGYLLVLAAAMLPAGLAGDLFGRKRVMMSALVLFGAGSAACATAPSAAVFTVARLALGLAGAGVTVMALSSLTVLFSEEERPRAVGVWAGANFLALPLGPILGGWLLSDYWWGWVFLINVPVVIIGLAATWVLIPESRSGQRPGADPAGMVGSVAGLVCITYGAIRAGQHGWGDAGALALMVGGVAVMSGFLWWERVLTRRPGGAPLLDMSLFASPSFTWGVVLSAIAMLAVIGVLFTMPQYFQAVRSATAMGSGVRLLPLMGGLLAGALPADQIAARIGAKLAVTAGFALLGAGMALGAATTVGSSGLFVAIWMAVLGIGMGLCLATAASAALVEISSERSGTASAVVQATQKTGGPLGSAVIGSALSAAYQSRLTVTGLSPAAASAVRSSVFDGIAVARRGRSAALLRSVEAAFTHGMDTALLTSAAIAAVGALLALVFLPARTAPAAVPPAPAPHPTATSR
jgi:MFS transporter, DHA2 family, multidrug resistance protein